MSNNFISPSSTIHIEKEKEAGGRRNDLDIYSRFPFDSDPTFMLPKMAGNEIWRPAGEPNSKGASIFPRSAERGKSAREYLKRQTIRFTPAVRCF
jgi:hypothetical protein